MAFQATISGIIDRAPEVSYSKNNSDFKLLKLNVKTTRYTNDGGPISTWVSCTAWGKDADEWEGKLSEGDEVIVSGRYEFRTYQKQDGTKGYDHTIQPKGIVIEKLGETRTPGEPTTTDELPF